MLSPSPTASLSAPLRLRALHVLIARRGTLAQRYRPPGAKTSPATSTVPLYHPFLLLRHSRPRAAPPKTARLWPFFEFALYLPRAFGNSLRFFGFFAVPIQNPQYPRGLSAIKRWKFSVQRWALQRRRETSNVQRPTSNFERSTLTIRRWTVERSPLVRFPPYPLLGYNSAAINRESCSG